MVVGVELFIVYQTSSKEWKLWGSLMALVMVIFKRINCIDNSTMMMVTVAPQTLDFKN